MIQLIPPGTQVLSLAQRDEIRDFAAQLPTLPYLDRHCGPSGETDACFASG
jgi:hypothetical protein